MSTVYRAFDTVLERQVAIKVLHPQGVTDADQLERFRREARAVAQLNHPHIVTVIDAGEQDDRIRPTPYIVFEYVEGETLKARIRRNGKLPGQRGHRLRDRDRARPRRGPRARDRAPRREAPERPRGRGGSRQGHRLRHRPHAGPGGADRRRTRAGHDRLRLPRAGPRPCRDRPVRPLLPGHRDVRDAHRRGALQGREPGRRRDEARPRGPAGHPGPPPRGQHGAGGGPRQRDREGPRQALRRHGGHGRGPRGRARARDEPQRPGHRGGDRGPADPAGAQPSAAPARASPSRGAGSPRSAPSRPS